MRKFAKKNVRAIFIVMLIISLIAVTSITMLQRGSQNKSPDYVSNYYTYTLNGSQSGYVLALNENFKAAIDGNRDYIVNGEALWVTGSALPAPDSAISGLPIIDMRGLFMDCTNVISLDLSAWDTSNIQYMSDMFKGCSSLNLLTLTSFNTSCVIRMDNMFNGCINLLSLDLSSFDITKITNTDGMFTNSGLTSLIVCTEQEGSILKTAVPSSCTISAKQISEISTNSLMWEKGGYTGTGQFYRSSTTIVTKDFVPQDTHLVYADDNYVIYPIVYDENDNYLGFWNGSEIVKSASKTMFYINAAALAPNKLKLMVKKNDGTDISVEEYNHIHFLNQSASKSFAPGPTLTFIDDDGSKNALENWESICDELEINITSALVTNAVGDGIHVSWQDVARLQSKGFEFVSHTHNHINLTTTSTEKIVTEFKHSIQALIDHGCAYNYLVYPYNAINKDLIPLVSEYFDVGIGLGSGEANNTLPIYTYHIRRYSINNSDITIEKEYNGEIVSVATFKSLDTLKDFIDDAIINNGWVIIMTHLRNDGDFYFDDEIRANIIELCNYAMQKGVDIQTFGEAYENFKNQSETGTIYDDSYEIVDCNGILHYKR